MSHPDPTKEYHDDTKGDSMTTNSKKMDGEGLNVHRLVSNCSCGKTNVYDVELSGEAINHELLGACKAMVSALKKGNHAIRMVEAYMHNVIAKAEGRS